MPLTTMKELDLESEEQFQHLQEQPLANKNKKRRRSSRRRGCLRGMSASTHTLSGEEADGSQRTVEETPASIPPKSM